ncbi:MAG: hypothetical protein ACKV0T_12570, partial [Planctomycetales bacterium]
MARIPKPWWWEARKAYYVTIRGVKHRLSDDKKKARDKFHELMSKPDDNAQIDSAIVLIDRFLSWCERNRPDSYEWYYQFLNPFCQIIKTLRVNEVEAHHVEQFIDKDTWGP